MGLGPFVEDMSMTIPYPKPTNRNMARMNAIQCLDQGEVEKSRAWSLIANTFPDMFDEDQEEDRRPYPALQDATEVIGRVEPDGDTVPVEKWLWDAMRAFCMQHVYPYEDHRTTISDYEVENNLRNWDIALSRVELGTEAIVFRQNES